MKVSIIGLGIMGAATAKKLLESGHEVTVYNRTRGKADMLLAMGAKWASTPADAASVSHIVISMVTDPDAAIQVALGEDGVAGGLQPKSVHADMSTISPDAAAKIADCYGQRGLRYVQAPVLGSRPQIERTKLLVIAGGDDEAIDQCRPIWSDFAKQVWNVGAPAQAAAMKLACNLLMGQMIVGLGQSLVFVKQFGMEPRDYLEIISQSALAAPQFQAKGESILKGEYTPNFTVLNLLKDLRLGAEAAKNLGLDMELNSVAQQLFVDAVSDDFGHDDYAAVVKVLADRAGVDLAQNRHAQVLPALSQ